MVRPYLFQSRNPASSTATETMTTAVTVRPTAKPTCLFLLLLPLEVGGEVEVGGELEGGGGGGEVDRLGEGVGVVADKFAECEGGASAVVV